MLHRISSKDAQSAARDQVSLDGEGVVDRRVKGEEALRGAGRLEPLELPLSSSDRLVRVIGPIVPPQTLLMMS